MRGVGRIEGLDLKSVIHVEVRQVCAYLYFFGHACPDVLEVDGVDHRITRLNGPADFFSVGNDVVRVMRVDGALRSVDRGITGGAFPWIAQLDLQLDQIVGFYGIVDQKGQEHSFGQSVGRRIEVSKDDGVRIIRLCRRFRIVFRVKFGMFRKTQSTRIAQLVWIVDDHQAIGQDLIASLTIGERVCDQVAAPRLAVGTDRQGAGNVYGLGSGVAGADGHVDRADPGRFIVFVVELRHFGVDVVRPVLDEGVIGLKYVQAPTLFRAVVEEPIYLVPIWMARHIRQLEVVTARPAIGGCVEGNVVGPGGSLRTKMERTQQQAEQERRKFLHRSEVLSVFNP